MQVICKQINSCGFDLKEVTTVFSNDFDYSFGGHGLELGKEYIVMGVATYKDSNFLYYLIDVNGKPEWFPYLLFNVSDHTLPNDWFIKVNNKDEDNDVYFILGFNELCNEEGFYDQLLGRNEIAMSTYFKRKIQIEQKLNEENQ